MYIALQFTVIIISLSKCLHVMIQQFEHENLNIKAAFLTMYSWNMKWARTNYNSTCDGDWMCSQRGIHVVCQFMRPTIRCHIRAFRLISWQSEAYRRESRGRATASCVAYWYLTSHVTSPHAAVGVQLARYLGTDRQTDRQAWQIQATCTCVMKSTARHKHVFTFVRFLTGSTRMSLLHVSTAKCRKIAKFSLFAENDIC